MSCTGANETGDCTFNGSYFIGNINANTLTLTEFGRTTYGMYFYGDTKIGTLIIDNTKGDYNRIIGFGQNNGDAGTISIGKIELKDKTKPTSIKIELISQRKWGKFDSTLTNWLDTGGVTVSIIDNTNANEANWTETTITPTPQGNAFVKRKYKFGGGGEIISISGPGASYLTGGGGSSGGGSGGSGGSSSGGGSSSAPINTANLTEHKRIR